MDNSHKIRLHDTFSAIAPLSENDVELAVQYFMTQTYQPKEYIFHSGDFVADVHFVLDGIGRYFYIDEEGNERNKSLVRVGGAFTSMSSLIESSPSPFFAQALTECTVASIRYESLVELSRSHRNWGEFLRKLFERLVLKKERREAGFLLLSAKERYQEFLTEFGDESKNIPLRHVAMYIGVTDVTLSRIRREMGLT